MEEDPHGYRILKLRAEILELGSAIRQLQRAGLDDAAALLLISRKRAQLDHLVRTGQASRPEQSLVDRGSRASRQ